MRVKFLDTTTYDAWMHLEDVLECKPKLCIAVGQLVCEDKETITLALVSSDDGADVATFAVIPKGAIKSKEVLTK